jgi:hypothetical protein
MEEQVWQILFDARDVLAVNKGEGKQDALADIAKEIVAKVRMKLGITDQEIDSLLRRLKESKSGD